MSGCRSCSGSCPEPGPQSIKKAEKLEKIESSGNPRYPQIFVGEQAIYSDEQIQVIVRVVEDVCNEALDRFKLHPLTVLKDATNSVSANEPFDISQPAGDSCWRLQALL